MQREEARVEVGLSEAYALEISLIINLSLFEEMAMGEVYGDASCSCWI